MVVVYVVLAVAVAAAIYFLFLRPAAPPREAELSSSQGEKAAAKVPPKSARHDDRSTKRLSQRRRHQRHVPLRLQSPPRLLRSARRKNLRAKQLEKLIEIRASVPPHQRLLLARMRPSRCAPFRRASDLPQQDEHCHRGRRRLHTSRMSKDCDVAWRNPEPRKGSSDASSHSLPVRRRLTPTSLPSSRKCCWLLTSARRPQRLYLPVFASS